MAKYNILFVIWALEPGGAEQVVVSLTDNLDRGQFRPVVCCLNRRGTLAVKDDVAVYCLDKRPGWDWSVIGKLKAIIKKERINLVNTHLWTANVWGRVAAWQSGIPVVVTEHSVDTWKPVRYRLIDRVLKHFMRKMITVADEVKDFYCRQIGIRTDMVTVVTNGVAVEDFNGSPAQEECKQQLGIAGVAPVIGMVGRLSKEKGHIHFIEAFPLVKSHFPGAGVLVVGDGEERGLLEARARTLNLEPDIRFLGTRVKDLPMVYQALDVLVQPSLREGLSLTILEALASGKPVVATEVGSNASIISDPGLGRIVPPQDPAALAAAVIEVLHSPDSDDGKERRRALVRTCYSSRKMTRETEAVFREALDIGRS